MANPNPQLRDNDSELWAPRKYVSTLSPEFPKPWIGDKYLQIWRHLTKVRRKDKFLLNLSDLQEILKSVTWDTVEKFASEATYSGLFVRYNPGKYVILPPNRAFTALGMKTWYHAQLLQFTTALKLLGEPHLFICYGANYYSKLGINEVHLGLPLQSTIRPHVGKMKIDVWNLDKIFFENLQEVMGPRHSYRKISIPSVEDVILLLGYTQLPRFKMMMENIMEKQDFNANNLVGSTPGLNLVNLIEPMVEKFKNISLDQLQPRYIQREVQLSERLQNTRYEWLASH